MKIGMTLGDPAGIGPELILKSADKLKKVLIFGNKNILTKTARDLHMLNNYNKIDKNIIDCVDSVNFHYGEFSKKTAQAAIQSLNSALESGLDIIITPPIVKDAVRLIIPDFVGHTEYLAQYYKVKDFAMVGLWQDKRIMLLTTHQPLRHVFKKINPDFIVQKIALFHWGLIKYFGIKSPHIATCALNPHAFEFSLGEDEQIKMALLRAQQKGIKVEGPFPADSIFDRDFDGFLAIYHDQAMIYLKSKKDGLNFTLGLPIIRLSPLYGAALDIAGKNRAEASGLTAALRQGVKIYRNLRNYEKKSKRI